MSTEPIEPSLFRTTMAGFATGVTVISVRDDLDDVAMTATAISSVSLDPPLIALFVEVGTHMHEVLSRNDRFAVTVLSAGQRMVAARFGTSGRPSARLLLTAEQYHRGSRSSALVIDNGVAGFECAIQQRIPAGDHTALIAAVIEVDYVDEDNRPLLRYRHRYHELG
jgi:flavin reductase (DIM6/NTAB) family NADH-FMN oxidoreductase RutF